MKAHARCLAGAETDLLLPRPPLAFLLWPRQELRRVPGHWERWNQGTISTAAVDK